MFGYPDSWYEELVSTMVIFVLRLGSDVVLEEIVELETELEQVLNENKIVEQEVQDLQKHTELMKINMSKIEQRCSVQLKFPKGNSKSD